MIQTFEIISIIGIVLGGVGALYAICFGGKPFKDCLINLYNNMWWNPIFGSYRLTWLKQYLTQSRYRHRSVADLNDSTLNVLCTTKFESLSINELKITEKIVKNLARYTDEIFPICLICYLTKNVSHVQRSYTENYLLFGERTIQIPLENYKKIWRIIYSLTKSKINISDDDEDIVETIERCQQFSEDLVLTIMNEDEKELLIYVLFFIASLCESLKETAHKYNFSHYTAELKEFIHNNSRNEILQECNIGLAMLL